MPAGAHGVADTIHVPGDHPTIQQAINAAGNGDIIEVAAGTYQERINTNGKAIRVRGAVDAGGAPATTIDGQQGGSVVLVNSGEDTDTIFQNLLLRNGSGHPDGWTKGGGAFVGFTSRARFVNCHFIENTAEQGGGAFVWQGAEFQGCTFIGNQSTLEFQFNGAALVRGDSTGWPVILDDCTITGNIAAGGNSWAVYSYFSGLLGMTNSTVCGNEGYECNACTGSSNYVNDDCPVECDPTSHQLSPNSNLAINERANRCPCEKEWGSCGSWDGQWAVAYDLSQGETANRDVTISCITFGTFNDSAPTNGSIQLWRDLDGGAPTYPGQDLELIETADISIVGGEELLLFDPPVFIPANTSLVVTMHAGWNDGYLSVGGNNSASSSPTWYRDYQGFCADSFRDVADLGYPNFSWVTFLSVELSAAPCPADFNNDGNVDGADLGVLISSWGPCAPPPASCVADITGNGTVDGGDLGLLIAAWGACPG